jgi:hypothetical protein
MRHPEQRLWDAMRAKLTGHAYYERVENAVGAGRPDVDVLVGGIYTPVELKATTAWPKTARGAVLGNSQGLNLAQRNWHRTWRRWGGRSLIVVGVGEGRDREVFTILGTFGDHLNKFNSEQLRAMAAGQGWAGLFEILRSMK